MPNAHAKITVTADGVGFHRTMTGVEHRLKELSGFAEGLKGSLATAFGGATIALAIESMVEFADQTIKGADALNMTVKQFEALKILARETGLEFDDLTNASNKFGAAAEKALQGNTKQLMAMKAMGITSDDLRNLKDFELLQKAMGGLAGRGRGEQESLLRDVGIKNPSRILAAQPQLAEFSKFQNEKEANGQLANPESLRELAALKDEFEELTDELKASFVPALVMIIPLVLRLADALKIMGIVMAAMVVKAPTVVKSVYTELKTEGKSLVKNSLAAMAGDKRISDAWKDYMADVHGAAKKSGKEVRGAWEEITDIGAQGILQVQADAEKRDKILAAKKAQFEKEQAEKGKLGGADREVLQKQKVEFGSNQFLKVGGFLGTNMDTRLSMTQQNIENNTKVVAQNTGEMVELLKTKTNSEQNQDDAISPLG